MRLQDFDPVRHVLEHIPSDENDLAYLEKEVLFLFLIFSSSGRILHSASCSEYMCKDMFLYILDCNELPLLHLIPSKIG
jgi:hypothetical protein